MDRLPKIERGRFAWRAATAAGRGLIEMLYPRRCAGCGRRGTWVCAACDAALPRFVPPWCHRCGVPRAADRCHCANLSPALDGVRSVASFDGWLRSAILDLKYRDEWARADLLGDLLAEAVERMKPVDALVPVPLHPARQRRRGYNQAALLARRAGAAVGVPVNDALRRVRSTPRQVGSDAAGRRANVSGAFAAADEPLTGLRLVLIDDVITTGSTLGACAEVLRAAGAAEVRACTLGREI